MGSCVAFLTRLRQIADEPVPAEERRASAFALLDAYKTRLHSRFGIGHGGRLTRRAKSVAEDALDKLRLEVLKAEINEPAATTTLFAATRYRIEMARRALALRLAHDEETDASAPVRPLPLWSNSDRVPAYEVRSDDRRIIRALRRQLAGAPW